ncbi:MAG: hypothetical protein IKS13_06275 [Ruminococcus sp.]|nr:hypothetical protein [Ruminococcus sp.]MBQ3947317.1 hypothetical protein [Ruminococcus sp.]MBR6394408.1 hypothetical protein [Ruminococcus sp.]MCR5731262.1 hypothetical protein [Ruminococcus sp.]
MDKDIIITSAIMLTITGIELFCIFCCSKLRPAPPIVTAVIPISANDPDILQKLDDLSHFFSSSTSAIDRVLLVNIDAGEQYINFCNKFCDNFSYAEFISIEEMPKKLSEIFAIQIKT